VPAASHAPFAYLTDKYHLYRFLPSVRSAHNVSPFPGPATHRRPPTREKTPRQPHPPPRPPLRRPHPLGLPLPRPRDPRQTALPHAWRPQPRPAHAREPAPAEAGGRDRVRAAHTIHGYAGAEPRAKNRYRITLLHRTRVITGAADYQAHLPPAFLARFYGYAPELLPPPQPTGGISAAADRMRRRAVAAALAPWKQAIATARAAHLAARAAARAAQPHAPVRARPPRDAGAAQPHAPIRRPADPAAATRANRPPQAPAVASPPHATQNATQGRRPTPPRPAPQSPPVTAAAQPHVSAVV
jgi:hypothetical protein